MKTSGSLRKWYYGKPNPTPQEQFVSHLSFALLISCIYAFWIDFAPTELTFKIGAVVGISSGLFLVIWSILTNGNTKPKFENWLKDLAAFLLLVAMYAFGFSTLFIYSIPSIATQIFGEQIAEDRYFVKYKERRGRNERRFLWLCDHRIIGEYNKYAFPDYFCISKEEFNSREDTFWAEGYESAFGTHYSNLIGISKYDIPRIKAYFKANGHSVDWDR